MKMISAIDGGGKNHSTTTCHSERRKPLQLLTGIFTRKNNRRDLNDLNGQLMQHEDDNNMDRNPYIMNEDADHDLWASSDVSSGIPEPREALHSPYHARTIDQDMENLRLSRQDNPYLQVLASRECLMNESDDCSEYEEKHLMSKENLGGSRDPLTVAEVHARLVRSPPPIMWTKGRNSEPSFSRFLTSHSSVDGDCVFQFPPTSRLMSPTNSCRSHHSGPAGMSGYKVTLNAPFDYNSRMRDNTLEAVTGKFNLSPQPRRRPDSTKTRTFSDLTS